MVIPPDKVDDVINQHNQSEIKSDQSKHSLQTNNHSNSVIVKESEIDQLPERKRDTTNISKTETEDSKHDQRGSDSSKNVASKSDQKGSDSKISSENKSEAINVDEFQEFSTMGDTEAMMLQVNTQDGATENIAQNCDKEMHADKTVTSESHGANIETAEMDTGTPAVSIRNRQPVGRKQVVDKPSGSQKENVSTSGRSTPVQNRVKVSTES